MIFQMRSKFLVRLVENNKVFVVKDGKLVFLKRNLIIDFYNQNQAFISGLKDGELGAFEKFHAAAFEGMDVSSIWREYHEKFNYRHFIKYLLLET